MGWGTREEEKGKRPMKWQIRQKKVRGEKTNYKVPAKWGKERETRGKGHQLMAT